MKALTIWQPWASLIAAGAKRYETRSWETDYRGPIAIHAAAKWTDELYRITYSNVFRDALEAAGVRFPPFNDQTAKIPRPLPLKCVIATGRLVACHRTNQLTLGKGDRGLQELVFGDFGRGRYAWEIADVVPIEPVPAMGLMGLWDWDESALAQTCAPASARDDS